MKNKNVNLTIPRILDILEDDEGDITMTQLFEYQRFINNIREED